MAKKRPTTSFTYRSSYPCSKEKLYDWHSRPGALERLMPPWQKYTLLRQEGGIEPGGMVELKMSFGPLSFLFCARHTENIPGIMFKDIQEKGPFNSWEHSHFFEEVGQREASSPAQSVLSDRVEYRLPGHDLLPVFVKDFVHRDLQQLFHHRKTLLQKDIALHEHCSTSPLRILVTGASGVIGRDLLPLLRTGGHQVFTLVRRSPNAEKGEIYWDPANGILNGDDLPELDGIIHLAGEYIGLSRWKEDKKRRVIDSRIKGTKLLAETLAAKDKVPGVLLCASAVGYYGNCHDKMVDEDSPSGDDFISEVCRLWEKGTKTASKAGIRTVFMRLGVGLTPQGGALQKILSSSPFGFIRRFGSGRQYISWISRDDMVAAMLHCLSCPSLSGPVNIAAPQPVTNGELMRTIAAVTGRPLLFPLPAWLLKMIYGQMASEILLSGCRASARKLTDSGFKFRHPTLEPALRSLLGRVQNLDKEVAIESD